MGTCTIFQIVSTGPGCVGHRWLEEVETAGKPPSLVLSLPKQGQESQRDLVNSHHHLFQTRTGKSLPKLGQESCLLKQAPERRWVHLKVDKSPGRQAKPQSLAVW